MDMGSTINRRQFLSDGLAATPSGKR